MCTYNDGSTIFFLSTNVYNCGTISNSRAVEIKPNATFTLNGKSYTETAYAPGRDDLYNYTTVRSRARDNDYWAPLVLSSGTIYYWVDNSYGRIIDSSNSSYLHVYLAIKITV